MNCRARLASVVAFALLVTARAGYAQKADSIATRGPLPGRGAIGGQVGGTYMYADGDYAEGAQPRFSFVGHFRYDVSKGLGWQVSPYFTWSAYVSHAKAPYVDLNFPAGGRSKEKYLSQLVGVDTQIQFFRGSGRKRWHLGFGPSVYRVVVENHRKVLKDPASLELHSGMHLGANAELGFERFLQKLPNTSIELTGAWHMALARDDVKFVSGWNGSPQVGEFRVGAHYYYEFRKPKPKSTKPGLGN